MSPVQVEEEEEDIEMPREHRCKRQKKTRNNRPPVCTFFNYLNPTSAATESSSPAPVLPTGSVIGTAEDPASSTNTTPAVAVSEPTTTTSSLQDMDEAADVMEGLVITESNNSMMVDTTMGTDPAVSFDESENTTAEFTKNKTVDDTAMALFDDDDSASAETVNTSNKSVDIYLRDTTLDKNITPAVDRWKKPPPPGTRRLQEDLDEAFYVTSKCGSDDESEDEDSMEPAKPSEIIVRIRGRCPRLHKWQTKPRVGSIAIGGGGSSYQRSANQVPRKLTGLQQFL